MSRGGHLRRPRHVLVVSADRKLVRAIGDGLARLGVAPSALVTVRSSTRALHWVAAERPDLVVLDDAVADLGGGQLVSALAREGVDGARVIYVAAHHTLELERLVRRLGVLYYTEKPPACGVIERIAAGVIRAGVAAGSAEEPDPRLPPSSWTERSLLRE